LSTSPFAPLNEHLANFDNEMEGWLCSFDHKENPIEPIPIPSFEEWVSMKEKKIRQFEEKNASSHLHCNAYLNLHTPLDIIAHFGVTLRSHPTSPIPPPSPLSNDFESNSLFKKEFEWTALDGLDPPIALSYFPRNRKRTFSKSVSSQLKKKQKMTDSSLYLRTHLNGSESNLTPNTSQLQQFPPFSREIASTPTDSLLQSRHFQMSESLGPQSNLQSFAWVIRNSTSTTVPKLNLHSTSLLSTPTTIPKFNFHSTLSLSPAPTPDPTGIVSTSNTNSVISDEQNIEWKWSVLRMLQQHAMHTWLEIPQSQQTSSQG
jgi:hypothetical protein